MTVLIVGLALFLGAHSIRIFADGWRSAQIARLGANAWKGLYSLASLAGFVLICWGFGLARVDSPQLWLPPTWLRHVSLLLVALAFVLFAAAYVPANGIKPAVGHPMVLAVKTWAFAHLLANGRLVDVVLFGAFLVWAIADYASSRRRDRANGTSYPKGTLRGSMLAVVIGLLAWAVFGHYLHRWMVGVSPF